MVPSHNVLPCLGFWTILASSCAANNVVRFSQPCLSADKIMQDGRRSNGRRLQDTAGERSPGISLGFCLLDLRDTVLHHAHSILHQSIELLHVNASKTPICNTIDDCKGCETNSAACALHALWFHHHYTFLIMQMHKQMDAAVLSNAMQLLPYIAPNGNTNARQIRQKHGKLYVIYRHV